MKKDKFLNPGGINGTGTGVVNVNSEDFKALQQAIIEHNKKYTPEERMKYDLIALHIQMKSYISKDYDREYRSVGEFLKGYVKAIGIKNKTFAQYIDIEESNLSAIIRGKRKINLNLALKLEHIFGVDADIWLRVQSKNELQKLKEERKDDYEKYQLADLLKKVG